MFIVTSGIQLPSKTVKTNVKFELIQLFVIFTRLTPVYAVILGFMATLMIYTTTGPNWDRMVYFKTACRYNWWNNLLYVNNYVQTYPREVMIEFIIVGHTTMIYYEPFMIVHGRNLVFGL